MSEVKLYISRNKKVLISLLVAFALAAVIGIIMALRAVDGEFERVPRVDAETGTGKVFFIGSLALAACYFLVLLAGVSKKTAFVSVIPFLLIGFMFGRYACALIGRYDVFGVVNLIFIYIPFFLISTLLLMVTAVCALSAPCSECSERSSLKPSFLKALKIFAVNIACNFVFVVIVGSICGGVIIVKLF